MARMGVDQTALTELTERSPSPRLSHEPSDTLSDVLEVVRLTGALFFLVDARTPWVAEAPASTDLCPSSFRAPSTSSRITSSAREPAGVNRRGMPRCVSKPATCSSCRMDMRTNWRALAAFALAGRWTMRSGGFGRWPMGNLPFVVTEGGDGSERLQLVCGFLGCDALPFNPVLTTLPFARARAAPR